MALDPPLAGADLTAAFWMRYETIPRGWCRSWWLHFAAAEGEGMHLCTDWSRLRWHAKQDGPGPMSRGEFAPGRWHHVAVVVSGLTQHVYLDGAPQFRRAAFVPMPSATSLWIGRSAAGGTDTYAHGAIEDLIVLDRPLAADEVRGLWRRS